MKPPTLFGATEPRQTPPAGLPVLWFEDVAMRAKVESAMRAAVILLHEGAAMSHLSEPDADRQLDEGREPVFCRSCGGQMDDDDPNPLCARCEDDAKADAQPRIADDEDVDAYFDRFGV